MLGFLLHEFLVLISTIKNNLPKMIIENLLTKTIIENLYLVFKIKILMIVVDYQLRFLSCR